MELYWELIGILEIILLYLAEKIANTEYGTNMADNFIAPQLMIMLLLASSGHLTETTLL